MKLKVRTLSSVHKQSRVNELLLFQSCSNSTSFPYALTDLKIDCNCGHRCQVDQGLGVFLPNSE